MPEISGLACLRLPAQREPTPAFVMACGAPRMACGGEFVNLMQPLPLVTAQYREGFAEPRPEETVLTSGLRQATSPLYS
jgi:hypothetical protein